MRKVAAFTATVGVGTVLGFVSVPTLVGSLGAQAWATIALCQAVCQLAGVAVAFGWGVVGPSTVAHTAAPRRPQLYADSLVGRGYLFLVTAAATWAVLVALTRGAEPVLLLLGAVAYLLPFAGGSWYFVGESRPGRLFFFDSLPSLLGTIAGLIGAALTRDALVFLGAQALGNAVAVAIDAVVILRSAPAPIVLDPRPATVLRALGGQRHAVASAALTGLYVSTPVMAVQLLDPAVLPVYVMADRFFRYASLAFAPVQQYFQGWIPGPVGLVRRAVAATWVAAGFGLAGGLAIALLSPWASLVLSHGVIEVAPALSIPFGIAFVGVTVASVVGYACLVALGRSSALAISALLGAIVGIPLMIVFAALRLPPGVAWAVALSELIVAGYQVGAFRRALAQESRTPEGAGAPG